MKIKNKVQLITYPDSLGGNLKKLKEVLDNYLPEIFQGGIHILPPFPSSGDRGFAPLTYLKIEPDFGAWDDIKILAEKYDIMLDLMINHISAQSEYFQDFLQHGRKSKYADLFLTIDKIFPNGQPDRKTIEKIFLRREEPYSDFTIKDTGEIERVWTTFGKVTPSEQIDLDINSLATKKLLEDFFSNFEKNNISMIRLDAIGFVVKKPNTSCFMVEPEVNEILDWVSDLAESYNIELLPEVHAQYKTQFKLAEKGFPIYDFILPYMILEAISFNNCSSLLSYLKIRPENQFTMLDCHDGIPIMPDLNDLVSLDNIKKIVDLCVKRGSNLSLIFSPNHRREDGFNVHQIRGTIYSILGENDDAYIAARAIQFFVPGIPQVYYVGLFAGKNDEENVQRTGEGREINRHNFLQDEIEESLNKTVVKRLIELIKFRNEHPAFNGKFNFVETNGSKVILFWKNKNSNCKLTVNLNSFETKVEYTNNLGTLKTKVF